MVRYLNLDDIDEIVKVENETWIPPMQAPRERIENRIKNGHRYLGYEIDGDMAGIVAWSYQYIKSLNELPKDFSLFSSGESILEKSNVAFIYNVGVAKKFRGQGVGTKVVREALNKIKEDGVTQVYLDGRCPSYNGSTEYEQEHIEQQTEFKKRIDKCIRENKTPTIDDIEYDPVLRFYKKLGFKPVHLISNFIPQDSPSGGNRIIMYIKFS